MSSSAAAANDAEMARQLQVEELGGARVGAHGTSSSSSDGAAKSKPLLHADKLAQIETRDDFDLDEQPVPQAMKQ